MWRELANESARLRGGVLRDFDDNGGHNDTEIVSVQIRGEMFEVVGEHFTCSANTKFTGVTSDKDWLVVVYQGGRFAFTSHARMRWSDSQSKFVVVPEIDALVNEIVAVCRKHNLWLSHEDIHGAFTITNEPTDVWLRYAHDWRKEKS